MGFLLSVFYSTRLIAMIISIIMDRENGTSFSIYPLLLIVALSWMVYGYGAGLTLIIPALIIEGTSQFLFEIFLWTKIQLLSDKRFLGRVIGLINILANASRILGILFAYYIIKIYDIKAVFKINADFVFLYGLYKLLNQHKNRHI